MAVRTIDEHVESLLTRRVTEHKLGGAPRPDLEAAAVFDSIILTLLLNPRAVLYLMFLARNGLLQSLVVELALIDELITAIQDLGNPSFRIGGDTILRRARTALLNLERLPGVSSDQAILKSYNAAIDEFLESQLSKNVRAKGSEELRRPSAEVLLGLPEALAVIKEQHSSVLRLLYTLAVGVDNFDSSPFSHLLGASTVARVRKDLDGILAKIAAGGDPSEARDFTIRLIGSRTALQTVTSPPRWDAVVVSEESAVSTSIIATPVEAASPTGLYGASAGDPVFTISLTGNPPLAFDPLFHFGPGIVTESFTLPVVVPADSYLFFRIDGTGNTGLRTIPFAAGSYADAAAVATYFNSQGAAAPILATAFASTNRLLFYAHDADTHNLTALPYDPRDGEIGPPYEPPVRVNGGQFVGLTSGATGATNAVSAKDLSDVLNLLFSSLITARVKTGQVSTVEVEAKSAGIGVGLSISCGPLYYLNGTDAPSISKTIELSSEAITQIQPTDVVSTPSGVASIVSISGNEVELDQFLTAFSGPVTVNSVLVEQYKLFMTELKVFMKNWAKTEYAKTLDTVDRAIAPLIASQSPAQRNSATNALNELKDELTKLLNVVENTATMLPGNAATKEKGIVSEILSTLEERGFNRAADLLIRGDVQAMLEMDYEKASYGGVVLRASSSVASTFSEVDPTSEEPSSVSAGAR